MFNTGLAIIPRFNQQLLSIVDENVDQGIQNSSADER